MKFKSNIESQAGIEDSAGSAGTDGKILSSLGVDGNGVAGVEWIDQGDVVAGEADKAKSVTLRVKNSTASAMTKGQVICEAVSATPPSGNLIEVALADNNGTNKMPALGILNEDLDAAGGNNDEGDAIMFGKVSGINTSAFEVGDEVFVSDVPGGLTTTKPTGVKYIQKVGVVIRDDNNNGTIEVFGAGRVNDVPTPLYVDHANQRLGIGEINPDVRLHVDGGGGILVNNGGGETVLSANSNSGIFSIGDTGGLGDGVYATNTGTSYFDIYSDGSVKFRMDSNGNFGIGTGTSGLQAKLAVAGIVHVGEDFEVSDGLNGDKTLAIDPTVGAFQIGDMDGITDEAHIEGDGENIKIFNGGSLTLITDSGQNVGIGAPIPTQKLHVNGNARLTGLFYDGTNSGGTAGQILSSDGGQTEWIDGSAIPGVPAGSGTTNYLAKWTPDANTLGTGVIYDNGTNVGIGITNPSAKLDVDGNLRLGTTGIFTIAQSPFSTTVFYVGAGNGSTITFGAPASNTQDVSVQGDLYSYQGSIGTKVSGSFNNKISYNGNNYLNSGNLGIGTTNPNAKLEVDGSVRVTGNGIDVGYGNNGTNFIQIGNGRTTNGYAYIDLVGDLTNADYGFRIIRNNTGPNTSTQLIHRGTGALDFNVSQGGSMTFKTNNTPRISINSSGNVGIGTTNLSEKLEVAGKVYIENQGVAWDPTTPGTTRGALHLDPVGNGANNTGNAITFGASDTGSGSTAQAGIYTRTDGSYGTRMYLATTESYTAGARTRMTIYSNGNVGIGSIAPAEKLDVVGNIKASGTVTATNFILSSDETLKDNIKEIDTKHVDVDWKNFELKSEPGIKRAGVIAQELEIKHPEFVRTASNGIKSVAYIDLLITKIAELEARLEKLEK